MIVAVVPAYNEEEHISHVVKSLLAHVDKIIVIDDGSDDATADKAKTAGAIVLRHIINRGQGAGYETAHEYARMINADFVVHFDADEQFDVADIIPAVKELQKQQADVLFGSRFLGIDSNIPWSKQNIILPIARIVDSWFSGLKLSDAHNGFRVLNKRALEKIHVTQDRMANATEIPAQVRHHHLKYIEFPVHVTYHEYGQKFGNGFITIRDLLFGKMIK
jgi:glycosyltransferase involved in cell wall biosynthesis